MRNQTHKAWQQPMEKKDARPICHMKPMRHSFADDGSGQVEFWECEFCGHTKLISEFYHE